MATDRCVARVLAMLAVAYPRQTVDKQTPKVYAQLLRDIPDEILTAAAEMHAVNSKWFPSVAELREAAMDIQAQADGRLTAEEAWIQVSKAVSSIGSWGTPEFDDLTQMAIDGLGGWRMLCQSTNQAADRAHFLRIYGGLLQRHQADANMLPEVREVIAQLRGNGLLQLEGGNHD